MKKAGHYFILGFILIVGIVLIDQYSKWVVMESMLRVEGDFLPFKDWFTTPRLLEYFIDERESYHDKAILPFLDFVMVWNQGVSFGMFDNNNPLVAYIFIAISLTVSLGFIIWLALANNALTSIACALIAGGAIGNAIDRIRFRAVADFISVHIGEFHFPVFNFADICISIGAVCLAWTLLLDSKPSYNTVDV